MTALAITGARAELLRAIAAGKVTEDWFTDEPGEIRHREYAGRDTRVTGKVRVMKSAGLCETDPADEDFHVRGIKLTEAGVRALAYYDAGKD
ncbi:hypothetical protein [Micromonospora tulbaghiae]|uniref:hypothetical protein n=1 Tax=Micromonospora tulbaghiae TaxID=479978 RepID=UPI0033EDA860